MDGKMYTVYTALVTALQSDHFPTYLYDTCGKYDGMKLGVCWHLSAYQHGGCQRSYNCVWVSSGDIDWRCCGLLAKRMVCPRWNTPEQLKSIMINQAKELRKEREEARQERREVEDKREMLRAQRHTERMTFATWAPRWLGQCRWDSTGSWFSGFSHKLSLSQIRLRQHVVAERKLLWQKILVVPDDRWCCVVCGSRIA